LSVPPLTPQLRKVPSFSVLRRTQHVTLPHHPALSQTILTGSVVDNKLIMINFYCLSQYAQTQ